MTKKRYMVDAGLTIDPIAWKALKLRATIMGVSASQLHRDIVHLWLGYAIDPRDPVYSEKNIGGELPGIIEIFPGYVKAVDLFGAKHKP
jgi:hypothetical protein